ncbi:MULTISPECIES: hypothetical protein [Nocardiopsis]|uniref:hypothetical protein n=1 Tax=Nocardiopsis TaxID=2013 RepID=UPI0003681E5B|nr:MULTISPECIES: hypothetical protein [Nocardiopsis]PWV57150.1 hypothetical protein BDW27_10210 [Nocardiopsis sp. L17-MgMaSL7]
MTRVACGTDRRGTFGRRAGGVVAGLVAAVLCAAPAVADSGGFGDADAVRLSLSGVDEPPLPGEEVVYRATVVNGAGVEVEKGLLAQHVPEPLTVQEVGEGGIVEEGVANWRVDLPEEGEGVYTVRVRVAEDAEVGERVVSTACLLLDRDAEPAACASDTLLVGDPTVLSRVGDLMDRDGLVRAVGVGVLMLLVWLLWRQWGASRRT